MSTSLKVECPHCSGSLKLKDRSADGKKVRCPKCQEVFKVELPEEDLDDFGGDDFGDDFGGDDEMPEEEESPRRSKGGSKASAKKPVKKKRKGGGSKVPLLIIGIALVVVLLVGGGILVVTRMGGSDGSANKIDLTYLPPNANMVMHMKVGQMLGSPLLADVMNHPAVQQNLAQQLEQTGLSAKEMTSMTIGVVLDETQQQLRMPGMNRLAAPNTSARYVTVIRTSTPLKAEEIGTKILKGTSQTHGGKTYYKRANGAIAEAALGDSLYFPEPNVAVLSLETEIKGVIDRGSKQVRRKEYDFVNPDTTLLIAFAPKLPPNPTAAVESPASQPKVQALERAANKTFRAVAFGVKVTDRVDLEIMMKCADGTGAGEIKSATEAIFADLKSQFESVKPMLSGIGMQDAVGLGEKTLASLKVDTTGTLVTAVGTIPSDVKAVGQKLSSSLPGMMMGMGGPPGGAPGFGNTSIAPPGATGGVPTIYPDASQLPPGALPPGGLPAGTLPPGTIPAGAVPAGAIPPGGIGIPDAAPASATALPGIAAPGAPAAPAGTGLPPIGGAGVPPK